MYRVIRALGSIYHNIGIGRSLMPRIEDRDRDLTGLTDGGIRGIET
jgi:hypothetical protein